jgi:RHH-type proline utilization regulon transcriptional repressor/proline dehydrogenase/delta 1-pyrroline-5-carboxylate dehydrogenase
LFTGSTETARSIQRALASRGDIPFVAETGGQNAMIVDSSALPEQVAGDILASAFDSAGQRCSALRILCLQDSVADGVLDMLKGAMAELRLGDPGRIETGVGPVIDAEAQAALNAYIDAHKDRMLFQLPVPADCAAGTFVPPTLLEVGSIGELTHEVFGPILHVVRFEREGLERLIKDINATGYGLTLGIHSRIDETIDFITSRVHAGNVYVNRNMIGAVVGVQPFGGEGLSGTGPKAGGPLMLHRLLRARQPPRLSGARDEAKLDPFRIFMTWAETGAGGLLSGEERAGLAGFSKLYLYTSPLPVEMMLPGPVGEDNRLRFLPRGCLLGIAQTMADALHQFGAALATGNGLLLPNSENLAPLKQRLPEPLRPHVEFSSDLQTAEFGAVLLSDEAKQAEILHWLARRPGPIVQIVLGTPEYSLFRLVKEKTISINTAAAGGNASLMTLGR